MIQPPDCSRRDSTLYRFTTKRLRGFIHHDHLLTRSTSDWISTSWWHPGKVLLSRLGAQKGPTLHEAVWTQGHALSEIESVSGVTIEASTNEIPSKQ